MRVTSFCKDLASDTGIIVSEPNYRINPQHIKKNQQGAFRLSFAYFYLLKIYPFRTLFNRRGGCR